jgi:hypothetical protein
MIPYEDVVQQRDGDVVAGATVTIYDTGTTDLVTIYSDDGITPKTNPMTTDADGTYSFWTAAGTYDIRAQVGSVIKTKTVSLASGSGGGTAEVTHTLITLPGHGIVPDATVADYTAMDAYIAGLSPGLSKWIEVTTGPETGITEIWYAVALSGSYVTYGPYGAWVKNPKYILGQNGEDHLVVEVEVPNWTPQGSGSSKYVAPAAANGTGGEWVGNSGFGRFAQNRIGSCVPVYADPLTFPADSRIRVTGNRANRSAFTLVLGISGEGSSVNAVSDMLDGSGTGALAIAGNKQGSAEFYLHESAVFYDTEKTTNVAGIPWAFTTPAAEGAQKYQPSFNGADGIVVWDHYRFRSGEPVSEGTNIYRLSFSDEVPTISITIDAATTLRLQSINADFGDYLLSLTNAGAFTITWPAGTQFEGGVEPAWSVTGTDLVGLVWNGAWSVVLIAQDVKVPA